AARRQEVENLRRQLKSSRDEVQELKLNIKSLEKKLASLESRATDAEHQKELLEQDVQTLRETKDDLYNKNLEANSMIGQLRQKIHGLEKEVQNTNLNKSRQPLSERHMNEQVPMGESERRELHQQLKHVTIKL